MLHQAVSGGYYGVAAAWQLDGPLDLAELRSAVADTLSAHEVLGARFSETVDGLVWSGGAARELEVVRDVDPGWTPSVRADVGPLCRAVLVEVDVKHHRLLLCAHRLVADRRSLELVGAEIAHRYSACIAGGGAAPPQGAREFVDVAREQQRLDVGPTSGTIASWRSLLDGAAAVDLPTFRPRPPGRSLAAAERRYVLGPPVAHLDALVVALGSDRRTVLTTAWTALLGRYTGVSDVVTGQKLELLDPADREVVGPLEDVVPFRAAWTPTTSFADLTEAVAAANRTTAALAVPFELLLEGLAPTRDTSRNPLVETAVGWRDAPATPTFDGLSTVAEPPACRSLVLSQWDVELDATMSPDGLDLLVRYATDLFDERDADRLVGHLATLLSSAAEDPQRPVAQLELLTADERNTVVRQRNDVASMVSDATLHELVAAQASATPDAVAVSTVDGDTTYAQLWARADHLSAHLRAKGVGPGDIVAVSVPRGADMVAAVLAVLQAGAAYLPVEAFLPPERATFMLSDSGCSLAVCADGTLDLVGGAGVPLFRLGVDDLDEPPPSELPSTSPGDLAYVLYTSGSTGMPKAVLLEHRNAVNLVTWVRDNFSAEERRRILAGTSLSWDLSITELFGSLCWGTTAVVVHDAFELVERGDALDVTFVNSSPSVVGLLVDRMVLPPSVRVVIMAGEALSGALVRRIYGRSTVDRVCNLYGPTEGTTYNTFTVVPRDIEGNPPLGRVIPNTSMYLLDDEGAPVPFGVVGEICIGGACVARGYLGRPEQTAEVFMPDPFDGRPGARLYRTGDYGRCTPDGDVFFAGRRDAQVKLHGLRIELGEIETRLLELPEVNAAAVLVGSDGESGDRLVAYVVPEPGAELVDGDLVSQLKDHLPRYMVPRTYVVLDAMPLNASGKIDRASLPPAERAAARTFEYSRRPRNAVEQIVASIVADVVPFNGPLTLDDDFFELGGDSLGALVLVSQLEEQLGVRLPLATLFEESTVGDLCAAVLRQDQLAGQALAGTVPLKDGTGPTLFLAPPLTGGVMVYRDLMPHLDMPNPVVGLQSPGLGDGAAPERTLEGLARRFVASVVELQPSGPLLLGGFSFGAVVADEMSRQLRDLGREVALVLMLDAHPFGGKPGWEQDLVPGPRGAWSRFRRKYANKVALRGHWWTLTNGSDRLNPSLRRAAGADAVRQINRLISAGYSYRLLEFPTALVDARKPSAAEVELPRRRVRDEVRRYPVVYEGASHTAFLRDPQAAVVGAAVDDAVAWALARSGDHAEFPPECWYNEGRPRTVN